MKSTSLIVLIIMSVFLAFVVYEAAAQVQPRAPNFQYFERPKYRYPYYDANGKGKLLYGYGGPELYQYKSYSPIEGIH
ncbi:hypothetical protein PVAND_007578 [Polypedilum vanderplanki]|uniref:Uncharacterized protein n=1 Tax=Polypedilum vanderplanki TaxID=319348 RepID=A0A9J6C740_POLVA|nr:hypothetical protein PVAND_007578 [Polypedilum vanderplanki]